MSVSDEDREADAVVRQAIADWRLPNDLSPSDASKSLASAIRQALIAHGWGPRRTVTRADQIRATIRQHELALDGTSNGDVVALRYASALRAVTDRCDWWQGSSWFTPDRIREAIAHALDVPLARGYGIQP
jgi:hypothetical protein